MRRHLTAFAMTGALALSGIGAGATPARASDHGAYIAGAAALAIIGTAVASSSHHGGGHRGGHHSGSRHGGGHSGEGHHAGRRHGGGHSGGHNGSHDGGYQYAEYGPLPATCRVRRGDRYGYSGNCLSSNYAGYEALPAACEVYIGGYHGTVYRDGCLDRYGYRTGYR